MLGIEAVGISQDFRRKLGGRVRVGRAGNAAAVQLPPSSRESYLLGFAGCVRGAKLATHQPEGLCKKDEKQSSGEKLRPPKPLACEKSAHNGEPSVLP